MPHLDTVTYLTQYAWTLIILLLLFSFVVSTILPRLQQQIALRSIKTKSVDNDLYSGDHSAFYKNEIGSSVKIRIFKVLLNLDSNPQFKQC
uniref:ATP synthase F0 subunit 8 n=1 Tax=Demospongiae sp. TaxID=2813625 RepID=A0AAU8HN05_9METZ